MIRNGPNRIISISIGLGLLQMVSEPDTERCANKDTRSPRRWIMRSHVGLRVEQNISYKGMTSSPY